MCLCNILSQLEPVTYHVILNIKSLKVTYSLQLYYSPEMCTKVSQNLFLTLENHFHLLYFIIRKVSFPSNKSLFTFVNDCCFGKQLHSVQSELQIDFIYDYKRKEMLFVDQSRSMEFCYFR